MVSEKKLHDFILRNTGGGPAVGEDSRQCSAPPSLALRPVLKDLRDRTMFKGAE